jgi:hypothetical protein
MAINYLVKLNMLNGYLFENILLKFKEDSTFLLLSTYAVRSFNCPKISSQEYLPPLWVLKDKKCIWEQPNGIVSFAHVIFV